MKVSDAMTPEVQLCTADDTLKDAAQAMAALGVGLLPVTDNDRLVGMISDRDVAIRGVGMGRGPEAGNAGQVFSAGAQALLLAAKMGEKRPVAPSESVAPRSNRSSGSI